VYEQPIPPPPAEGERLRASVTPDPAAIDQVVAGLGLDDMVVTFQDVVGLDDVKRQIHLRIVAPFRRRDVYQAFKRKAGGGILLYGPPGCGKTFIARATAGECNARFFAIPISEVVDQYFGQSEKMIHDLFEMARREAPTILFFDEFDAIGTSRGRTESQFWRTLVNQILMEMDGMTGSTEGVLVFAATNLPWNVDSAFRRPGRFDRSLFVPPPDRAGRAELLKRGLANVPGGEAVDAAALAARTELFTGADLRALVERASERALAASLESDTVHPVTTGDCDAALAETQSTALEWLASARNHARYANDSGQYDELVAFLKKHKRW
jgi:SpoVK/Ycf46/Vps4 family AAA+-type ATPase